MNNNFNISEQQIQDKWSPIIENNNNLNFHDGNSNVKDWLPMYSHYHAITENMNATTGNTPGMGSIALPGNYNGGQFGFNGQTQGSGDKIAGYLNLSMQIAADTVGFQCVPVVPATGLITMLTYSDVIYAGGQLGSATELPDLFKLDVSIDASVEPGSVVTLKDAGVTKLTAIFIGRSRLDGFPIFIYKDKGGVSIESALTSAANGAATDRRLESGSGDAELTINDVKPQYVRALEDHISGFSGQLFARLRSASSVADSIVAMKYKNMPYSREEGETSYTRTLGWRFYNKSVKPETWQIDCAVTREQIDDAKMLGYDVMSKAQKLLVNETTQSYNKNILERIFALGAKNHKKIYDSTGTHFNINWDHDNGVGSTDFVLGWDSDGVGLTTITTGGVPKANTREGGETTLSARHKIFDQILMASNMIAHRGRREPGNCIVTNMAIATFIQSLQGFNGIKTPSSVQQKPGLKALGTIMGHTLFYDPNMQMADTRIAVFRRGDGESPGLVYMPYRIADIVQTIAEATMAPKMQLKSRGKLVEVGHNPEIFYITLKVNAKNLFG